jgi:hypothetical protein
MKEFDGYKVDGSVRFDGASIEQIRWGGNDDSNLVLKVGRVYKVAGIAVHSYHIKLTLVGIDGRFNAASFTPV